MDARANRDAAPFLDKGARRREAQSLARTRDESDLVAETEIHWRKSL